MLESCKVPIKQKVIPIIVRNDFLFNEKYMCGVLLRFKFFPHVDEFSFNVVELILQKREFL